MRSVRRAGATLKHTMARASHRSTSAHSSPARTRTITPLSTTMTPAASAVAAAAERSRPRPPGGGRSRSSAAPTPARRPSPRSSCSTGAPSTSPAPSRPSAAARATVSDWMNIERERGILDHVERVAVSLQGLLSLNSSTPRPRRLQRRHLPHAPRRRRRRDAARRSQGRRGADEEALSRLPPQAGEMPIFTFVNKLDRPGARPVRPCRRGRERARHAGCYPVMWPVKYAAPSSAASSTGSRSACTCSTRPDGPASTYKVPVDVTGVGRARGCAKSWARRARPTCGQWLELLNWLRATRSRAPASGRGEVYADVLRQRVQQLRRRACSSTRFVDMTPPPRLAHDLEGRARAGRRRSSRRSSSRSKRT